MELNLVAEGLKFMVLGMVTVFLFLVLMVLILQFQAKLINKFFPEKVKTTPKKTSLATSSVKRDDNALVAAITAAIITHRKTNS